MTGNMIKTGCLPYPDGSGFELEIHIQPPSEYFKYDRIVLNPDSEFTDFSVEQWPEVRAAIDRAVIAHNQLSQKEQVDD